MSAAEERAALKAIAKEVAEELRKFTTTVLSYRSRIDIVITHLLSDADQLALSAADEVSDNPSVKRVSYGTTKTETSIELEKFLTEGAASKGNVPAPLPAGKRACSICRKPGHRAKNCPEQEQADLATAVQKQIAKRKAKKK